MTGYTPTGRAPIVVDEEKTQERQGMSREEIEELLRRGGYMPTRFTGYGCQGIYSHEKSIFARLYPNIKEAIKLHRADGLPNINPNFEGAFVAIFYGGKWVPRLDIDSLVVKGRLYNHCQENNVPVQEFLTDDFFISDEALFKIRLARETLSRLEEQLKERKVRVK